MYYKTQKYLVMGASKSGIGCVKHLANKCAKCYVYEQLKSPKIEENLAIIKNLGATILSETEVHSVVEEIDVVILSPGVPINHPIAVRAKSLGKRITGELEFGVNSFLPTIIGITGTNGKSTTVSMVDAILKQSGENCVLCGNIGIPITEKLSEINEDTIVVAEVSSFQLESVHNFCPHVACVLNLTKDHLERHYSMENYTYLKKRIFSNQRESEYTVLNFDDNLVRLMGTETRGKVVWVSLNEIVDGAYLKDGGLYFKSEFIIEEKELKVSGEHNVYDALFAIACAKIVGVKTEDVATALKNFKGIRHRLEFVATVNGVKYYNDSKATNTASTCVAIDALTEPTILILGGSEKGEDYVELFNKIKARGIKHVVITGASRFNMLNASGEVGYTDVTVTDDFEFAIKIAKMLAISGDTVLLSPACASFDKFSGYEQRGEAFIKAVGKDIE